MKCKSIQQTDIHKSVSKLKDGCILHNICEGCCQEVLQQCNKNCNTLLRSPVVLIFFI